ncbi:MAG TPA: glycoside hydrolase family 36 protein [Candidatus Sulfotelmatobacter sp.]|nr:glycoside hydrolase family 36 protein [Candidatus Sulfotelmatobacter sp.]
MKLTQCRIGISQVSSLFLGVALAAALLSCSKTAEQPKPIPSRPSDVNVKVSDGGPIVITTTTAEFQVLPSGFLQATLLKDGKRLSLDEPPVGSTGGSDSIILQGKEYDFIPDFAQTKVTESNSKLGRGKRVEIPSRPLAPSGVGIVRTVVVEAYDDFPNIALVSTTYKNAGSSDISVDQVWMQQHRLNAKQADPKAEPYDMWSFQGSSYDWGKDDVQKLSRVSSQPNVMGEAVKGGYGGGIPVVAFWTRSVGEAIGHVETLPWTLSMPVKVDADGRVNASLTIPVNATLKPGEGYSTPRSFVAVYSGDFYEPLRMWSSLLQREGWNIPKPSSEAYNVSWCGWGYEFNVTPKEMLGTVPKLKELGIKWATLDDRWFDTYGDWNPRSETFPGDSIKQMVDDFHKQGILVQLWWLPLGVEDGQGRWESHKYIVSKVVKEHPEWLILDKNGKHARMTRDLAALDPSLPEVQAYFKQLTEKFIRDWGFDGSKLDNIYSVPACYNPAHHHKSPQESVNAMGEVYKAIFETTRSIKPESVTQACPCGTPPSLAWLPFIDQAVTADPVGAVQVRRRIKMYKALLGPESAVYGDHVELSAMTPKGNGNWSEHGDDFASTLGTGGVPGTKFVWPNPGPKYQPVNLTSEKEAHWKKWIGLYNEKMLSKGEFRDLYVYGYDVPEAYAIAKDGKMYYAFFTDPGKPFRGEVELRGLKAGKYHVVDYTDGKDLGTVEAATGQPAKMKTDFNEHLLLEVSSQ